jgi:hypothetical protein
MAGRAAELEGFFSLLSRLEHHIRGSRDTHRSDTKIARNSFPFLKLHIIRHHQMRKQHLHLISSKEPPGTDDE